jgi:hypothetical protein
MRKSCPEYKKREDWQADEDDWPSSKCLAQWRCKGTAERKTELVYGERECCDFSRRVEL